MKKLLLIVFIFSGLIGFGQNLNVNGDIIRTDPTYTGAGLTIHSTQNNNVTFTMPFYGDFFVIGPGNAMNTGSFGFSSLVRGAIFSSSTSGVNALQSWHGLNRFNVYDGRSMFGQNVVDDGFSLVYVHGGFKADSIRLDGNPGATGDVLTKQANGTYQPQTPSAGGGASGVFGPAVGLLTNLNSVTIPPNGCNYTVQGKIVKVSYSGQAIPAAANSTCIFTVALPPGFSTWNGVANYTPVLISMNVPNIKTGLAQVTGQNQITVSFTNTTANVAYAFGFTMQYSTL